MRRVISRIANEFVERNQGADDLILVGLRRRGVPLANRIAAEIEAFEHVEVPVGALDTNLYRDDLTSRPQPTVRATTLPVDVDDKVVVLVDDVLYTGRSIRAALDALTDFGRPAAIQLAVVVDRGHRELPIRPDYVGKNVPTARDDDVRVRLAETDGRDEVAIMPQDLPDGRQEE